VSVGAGLQQPLYFYEGGGTYPAFTTNNDRTGWITNVNNNDAFDSAMPARTPGRDIFGPLDDHLPEVRIPAEVKLDATRAAHELGLDLTAYLRQNLYASLYGPEHVAMLHRRQLERVLGNARRADQVGLQVRGEVNAK